MLLLVKLRLYGMFYINFRKLLVRKWWLYGFFFKYILFSVIIIKRYLILNDRIGNYIFYF